MTESLSNQIIEKINESKNNYHRLTIVVAPAGAGKTSALQEVRDSTIATIINVNLELSRRMLDLTERQRALQLPQLLSEIISETDGSIVLLDNIEILFDVSLKQDPLRLLQNISRNKTVVAAWSGLVVDNYITYAAPDHLEYRRYPIHDFLVASPEVTR